MNYICDIFFWRNHIARYNCNVYCSIAMRIWFVYSARRKIINQHMTQLGRHHQSLSWNFLVWWSSNDRQIPSFKLSVLRINIEIKIKILCLAVNNWVLFIIFGKKNELIKSFMWLENVPIKNKPQKHRFFFFSFADSFAIPLSASTNGRKKRSFFCQEITLARNILINLKLLNDLLNQQCYARCGKEFFFVHFICPNWSHTKLPIIGWTLRRVWDSSTALIAPCMQTTYGQCVHMCAIN